MVPLVNTPSSSKVKLVPGSGAESPLEVTLSVAISTVCSFHFSRLSERMNWKVAVIDSSLDRHWPAAEKP